MKKIKLFLIMAVVVILTASCNQYVYKGQKIGILELTNRSISTVQEVCVNDSIYGKLNPGKTMKVKLLPGVYTWQLKGVNGNGCTPTTGTIVAGYTQAFNCSVN
jgi:hypothetical protein